MIPYLTITASLKHIQWKDSSIDQHSHIRSLLKISDVESFTVLTRSYNNLY